MFSPYIFKEVTTGAIGERTDIAETCEPAGNFVEKNVNCSHLP